MRRKVTRPDARPTHQHGSDFHWIRQRMRWHDQRQRNLRRQSFCCKALKLLLPWILCLVGIKLWGRVSSIFFHSTAIPPNTINASQNRILKSEGNSTMCQKDWHKSDAMIYNSLNEAQDRSSRFPSVDERVKIYMSNWYTPECDDARKIHYYNQWHQLLPNNQTNNVASPSASTYLVQEEEI